MHSNEFMLTGKCGERADHGDEINKVSTLGSLARRNYHSVRHSTIIIDRTNNQAFYKLIFPIRIYSRRVFKKRRIDYSGSRGCENKIENPSFEETIIEFCSNLWHTMRYLSVIQSPNPVE